MTGTILLVGGLGLLALTMVDFLLTTIGASVRSFLSGRVAGGTFAALRGAMGRSRVAHHASGPLVMTAVAVVWVLGIWLGWTLVFLSDQGSVTWADDGDVAGFWGTFGHAGRQVSTLGSGTTDPEGTTWYVAGVLGAISGMVVMTLAVSFILTTTTTVAGGRALCGLTEALDVRDEGDARTVLPALAQVVAGLNAAPFALYYSAREPTRRLPARLALLARDAAGSRAMRLYRPVLNDLPGLDVSASMSDEAYAQEVGRWGRAYDLAPMSGGAPREAARRQGG